MVLWCSGWFRIKIGRIIRHDFFSVDPDADFIEGLTSTLMTDFFSQWGFASRLRLQPNFGIRLYGRCNYLRTNPNLFQWYGYRYGHSATKDKKAENERKKDYFFIGGVEGKVSMRT